MTLNGVMAVILRYLAKIGNFGVNDVKMVTVIIRPKLSATKKTNFCKYTMHHR